MPAAIQVAREHLKDLSGRGLHRESFTVDTIHQTYAVVPTSTDRLCPRAQPRPTYIAKGQEEADAAIVFVRTRAVEVPRARAGRGFRAAGISGDVARNRRERMVEAPERTAPLDVLGRRRDLRGLDVSASPWSLTSTFRVNEACDTASARSREGPRCSFAMSMVSSYAASKLTGTDGRGRDSVARSCLEFRARRLLEVWPPGERGRSEHV